MATYTMLNGQIRLYDSTDDIRAVANGHVEVYDATGPTWTDKTTEAFSAAASLTGDVLDATADFVYIGHTVPFARINVDVSTVAAGSGALTVEYYNGSWTAIPTTVTDGTSDGTDTFAQDGVIHFLPPSDWVVAGDAELDAAKYYVRLSAASEPSQEPDCELLCPVDGQYFDLIFDEGNMTAPLGRARTEETMVHHRGRGNSTYSHYISGPDTPIVEPLDLSFSVRMDSSINRTALRLALACGNPNYSSAWDATGVSSKGTTSLTNGAASTFTTPTFEDASKKTVNVLVLWTRSSVRIGFMYHEVWFPPDQQSIAESEDGVIVSCTGLIYGRIEPVYWVANQY